MSVYVTVYRICLRVGRIVSIDIALSYFIEMILALLLDCDLVLSRHSYRAFMDALCGYFCFVVGFLWL